MPAMGRLLWEQPGCGIATQLTSQQAKIYNTKLPWQCLRTQIALPAEQNSDVDAYMPAQFSVSKRSASPSNAALAAPPLWAFAARPKATSSACTSPHAAERQDPSCCLQAQLVLAAVGRAIQQPAVCPPGLVAAALGRPTLLPRIHRSQPVPHLCKAHVHNVTTTHQRVSWVCYTTADLVKPQQTYAART